jgi:hypothetical protein
MKTHQYSLTDTPGRFVLTGVFFENSIFDVGKKREIFFEVF